jgi:hypothetical protein
VFWWPSKGTTDADAKLAAADKEGGIVLVSMSALNVTFFVCAVCIYHFVVVSFFLFFRVCLCMYSCVCICASASASACVCVCVCVCATQSSHVVSASLRGRGMR